MKIITGPVSPSLWQAQIFLAFCFENENIITLLPELDECCPWLAISPALRDFTGEKGQEVLSYGHPELKIPRVLILGAGKREKATTEQVRALIAEGVKKCRYLGMQSILMAVKNFDNLPGGLFYNLEEAAFAATAALYRFLELKTGKADEKPDPEELIFVFSTDNMVEKAQEHLKKGFNAANAVNFARNLDNLPANLLYPETLALRAANRAAETGFSCEVLTENALEKENMGCILAVGRGSAHPPRLIILEYAPENHKNDPPIVLLGKGITFDSGGICLKPPANMWQMKCDMSGAAAVLAAIDCACREKVERHIIGLLACAENMPDGNAFRPGDILTSASGETVEIMNTDAEGRLVLCDAIAYAQNHWQPAAIIDIATLTGACAVALGNQVAGLFANNEELAEKIMSYSRLSGENLWRLPLWAAYKEELKSPIADIRHTASREGGAITAALFLENFIKNDRSWAHLDIAGVDFASKNYPLCPEGATGFGTRILLEICRRGI